MTKATVQHTKVPTLRFPGFLGEWEEKNRGTEFQSFTTNSFSRELLNYDEGNIKNIHYGDIHTKFSVLFDIVKENIPFINTEVKLNKSLLTMCEPGDVIVADASEDYSDIGKSIEIVNTNNQQILAGLHTLHFRPKVKFGTGFIGYLLKTSGLRKSIQYIAQGSKVLGISKKEFNKINLYVPTLPEQKKIADFLSYVDDKITSLSSLKSARECYKTGIMQQIFSQKIRFRDENGREFGEWEEKKLGEIANLTSSKRVYLSDYVKVGIPFYRGKEVSELKKNIIPKDILYITEQSYNHFRDIYGVPQVNDILITAVGTLGNVLRIKSNDKFYFKDGNLIWLKAITQNAEFLDALLEFEKNKVLNSAIGSSQKALTIIKLNKLKFTFPNFAEQEKIANFLSQIDQKIDEVSQQIEKAKEWKKGLLQGLFI